MQGAEAAGHASPDRLQDFLPHAAWDTDELRDRVREFVVDSLPAEDAALIADETGDITKGAKSAGVARQYTGVTGQVENARSVCTSPTDPRAGGRSSTGNCMQGSTGRAVARNTADAARRPRCPRSGPARW
ncbi:MULTISPECIES: transposase [Streptomyces]|uniref:Transposase n=2 Tax=Streptomyces TaxID=1883 RepID=A0ABV9J5H2_9ACTN